MTLYIRIALYVLCAACMVYASRRLVHMLQLEGYRNKNLSRWIGAHSGAVYKLPVISSLCGLLLLLMTALLIPAIEIYASFILAAGYIWMILVYEGKTRLAKAKKPLVYTGRVKRLFVFLSLFYLIAAGGLLLLDILVLNSTAYAGLPLFVLTLCIGIGVMAANLMAMPVEAAVRGWYLGDARKILAQRSDLIRIGITGSYGKTSCKFILGTILSEKYDVLVPPSSYNTPMGVTRVVREQLKRSHEVLIAEMGARYVGDIKELCELVHPQHGLITWVGPQHLETMGSIENIAKTKYELIEGLEKGGCAFFPADNDLCRDMYDKTQGEKALFALDYEGEVYARAENIKTGSFGSRFDLVLGTERIACETKLLGKHNIVNITGCAAVAHKLGLNSAQIRLGIRKIQPIEHRLQLLPPRGGITVIDDAFNANPSGVRAAMDVLSTFEGRKIVVTPGLVELGDQEATENKAFGKVMAGVADVAYLIGEKHTRPIYDGLIESSFDKTNIHVFHSLDEATSSLWQMAKPGDVVIFVNDLPDNYNE